MVIATQWLLAQTPAQRGELRLPGRTEKTTGIAAFEQRDWATAERSFSSATSTNPQDAEAWKWFGMTYAAQEKYLQAEQPFTAACRLNPKDPDACYYLGRTLYSLSRFEPALHAYEKAAPNGRTKLGMALALEALGRDADAGRCYKEAIAAGDKQAAIDYAKFRRKQQTAAVTPSPEIRFEARDLPFAVRNGAAGKKQLPETMIAGIAVLDFNRDGWPDLYIANGANLAGAVLRNNRDGTFTPHISLSGEGFSMGAAAADFNNDGHTDLFVTGVRGNRLYRNTGGNFEDVTGRAGVGGDGRWSVAAAWLDYDNDGLLDLFVVRYVQWDAAREPRCGEIRQYCHPREFGPLANVLYRNLGGGRFADVSVESGIAAHKGKGMGVAVGDYDGDNRLDIFVANDTVPNFLFHNQGKGRFEETAARAGVAYNENGAPVSSMGAEFRDYDNDGREDLWVTALSNETFPLFHNTGEATFEDVTLASGIAKASLAWSGWSNAIADFNNDGWRDLFAANGHVMDNAELTSGRQSKQPNLLLTNGRAAFTARTLPGQAFHRGLAAADFDRDGRVDLAITRLNESAQVLWNRTPEAGRWIAFQLVGTKSNRDAIGAWLELETPGGRQWNRVTACAGYGATPSLLTHFGLGNERFVNRVTVRWPSGRVQQISRPAIGEILVVREP